MAATPRKGAGREPGLARWLHVPIEIYRASIMDRRSLGDRRSGLSSGGRGGEGSRPSHLALLKPTLPVRLSSAARAGV